MDLLDQGNSIYRGLTLAGDAHAVGNYKRAKKILSILIRRGGLSRMQEFNVHSLMSCCHLASREFTEAYPHARKHTDLAESIFGLKSPEYSWSIIPLCKLGIESRMFENCYKFCSRSILLMEKLSLGDSELYGMTLMMKGDIKQAESKWKEALESYLVARTVLSLHKNKAGYGMLLGSMGKCHIELEQWNEAFACCKETVDYNIELRGKKHPDYADAAWILADFYIRFKRYMDALPLLLEVLSIFKQSYGADHLLFGNIHKALKKTVRLAKEPHREKIEVGHMFRMCDQCSKIKENMEICSGCCCVWYCDSECQLAHWKKHKPQCFVCFCCDVPLDRDSTILRCSSCKVTHYCSPDCQEKDWKRHKQVCSSMLPCHGRLCDWSLKSVLESLK